MTATSAIYRQTILEELNRWKFRMQKKPGRINKLAKKLQTKINGYIPEKVHQAITSAIKQMIRTVLFGAEWSTRKPSDFISLEETEAQVQKKITFYKRTGGLEGGITGAGGILMGFADFPLLLGIKLKMLFDIATTYGFDVKDYRERLYILHIFLLAFCSDEKRKETFLLMEDWDKTLQSLPEDIHEYDWRSLQQEYRDYIDLAKMAQLIPVIGAAVGLVANYRLLKKLGFTAMQAYRMRWQALGKI